MPPWVCAHSDTPTPPFPRLTHAHCPSFPLHPTRNRTASSPSPLVLVPTTTRHTRLATFLGG